ncbi:MAG: DUF2339 domain-containing protein [Acidobacteriota bacterium]
MEIFLVFVVLAVPTVLTVFGVLGIFGFLRSRRALKGVEKLETELAVLRGQLQQLREQSQPSPPSKTVSLVSERFGGEAATEIWGDLETPAEPLSLTELQAEIAEEEEERTAAGDAVDEGSAAAGADSTLSSDGVEGEAREAGTEVRAPAPPVAARDAVESADSVASPPPIPRAEPIDVEGSDIKAGDVEAGDVEGRRIAAEAPSRSGAPSPPPVPPAAAGAGAPPPEAAPSFDLEKWLGLRGAAVVGGIALALAGLLFVKYSIDQGWLPPIVRVGLAFLTGAVAVAASEVMRRRRYRSTADGVAGAGLVILYGATWAAGELYDLLPFLLTFGLMALVTAAGCALAWRHRSLVVAVIGLVGGFLTPVLVSSAEPSTLGLFAYLGILNAALLRLASSRRWAFLPLLSAIGTLIYVLLWLDQGLSTSTLWLGVFFAALLAGLYSLGAGRSASTESEDPAKDSVWWSIARGLGLLPVAFLALGIAVSSGVGTRLLPLLALLALLLAASAWLGFRLRQPLILGGGVAATLVALLAWLVQTDSTGVEAQGWLFAGGIGLLGLLLHWRWWREQQPAAGMNAVFLASGVVGLLGVLSIPGVNWDASPWVWALGAAPLVVAALVQGQRSRTKLEEKSASGRGASSLWLSQAVAVAVGFLVGLTLLFQLYTGEHLGDLLEPASHGPLLSALLVALLFVVGMQFAALWRVRQGARMLEVANLTVALTLLGLCALSQEVRLLGSLLPLLSTAAFGLALLTATRMGSGGFSFASAFLAALAHAVWTDQSFFLDAVEGAAGWQFLALGFACVLGTTLWVPASGAGLRRSRWAWITAAAVGLLWFLPMHYVWSRHFGTAAIGVLPLLLALVAMIGLVWASRLPLSVGEVDEGKRAENLARRRQRLAWFAGVALGWIAIAIPLQLDKQWITVGWALQGAALVLLWRRLRHPGLVPFALLLYGAVVVRLLLNPALLGYQPSSGVPLLNWITYTYLLPILALLAGLHWLRQPLPALASSEGLDSEGGLESQDGQQERSALGDLAAALPFGLPARGVLVALGSSVVLLIFAWINLEIFNAFSSEARLTLAFDRGATQNLVLSLAWGAYAIALLVLGIAQRIPALRKASLGLLVLTLLKVFLVDLGELEGLYRVASLLGLAISLILVSVVYQRFVVGREDRPASSSGGPSSPPG